MAFSFMALAQFVFIASWVALGRSLDASQIFTGIALISAARLPLIVIQLFAQSTGEASECFARLDTLLKLPEAQISLSTAVQEEVCCNLLKTRACCLDV